MLFLQSDRRTTGHSGGLIIIALTSLYFLALYVIPPIREYNNFRVMNFDFGILLQSSYLLSRLNDLFMTTRGVHIWADNQDYFQILFALFHYLPSPHYWLLVFHSCAIYACGIFCLIYLMPQGRFVAIAVAITVWISPFMININMDLVHTEAVTTILILLLYFACKKGNRFLFYLFLLLALSCKEDAALTVGFFMTLVLLEQRWFDQDRFELRQIHFIIGLIFSVTLFFINLKVVLPFYKAQTCLWLDPNFAIEAMSSVPASPAYQETLTNWYKPSFIKEAFIKKDVGMYVLNVMWPAVFFVGSKSLLLLLPAAALFINIISKTGYFIEGFYHYDFCTMAAVIIIIIEGISQTTYKKIISCLLLMSAIYFHFNMKTRVPLGAPLTKDFYRFEKNVEVQFLHRLNEVLPENTTITADYNSINYLIDKHPNIYMSENPFRPSYFGLYGVCERLKSPPVVDLVIIRRDYNMDKNLQSFLSSHFYLASKQRNRFRIWVNPTFMQREKSKDFRQLLAVSLEN
ncbi:MAG: DUF2079 domain-containing protein [SAR324 cluster bacterium]|nr:DUF2079 domain-containing protein [SAR324 cluster bacterium]